MIRLVEILGLQPPRRIEERSVSSSIAVHSHTRSFDDYGKAARSAGPGASSRQHRVSRSVGGRQLASSARLPARSVPPKPAKNKSPVGSVGANERNRSSPPLSLSTSASAGRKSSSRTPSSSDHFPSGRSAPSDGGSALESIAESPRRDGRGAPVGATGSGSGSSKLGSSLHHVHDEQSRPSGRSSGSDSDGKTVDKSPVRTHAGSSGGGGGASGSATLTRRRSPRSDLSLRRSSALRGSFIVGQEPDGTILVASNFSDELGGQRRTHIGFYDPLNGETDWFYTHPSRITVVGASVNKDRTLLVITTLTPYSVGHEGRIRQDVFESSIIEIFPTGHLYPLDFRSLEVQQVQFLYDFRTKSGPHVVFILEGGFVHLYKFSVRSRKPAGVMVTSQPQLQTSLAESHVWCSWNPWHSTLNVVLRSSNTHPSSKAEELEFRSFTFRDNKKESLSLRLLAPFGFSSATADVVSPTTPHAGAEKRTSGRSSNDQDSQPYVFLGTLRKPYTHVARQFELIYISKTAWCLCHQKLFAPNGDLTKASIRVTIYVLHRRTHLNLTIPLPADYFEHRRKRDSRVAFVQADDMLFVYLPSVYCHVLFVGDLFSPVLDLVLSGEDIVQSLNETTSDRLVPFRLVAPGEESPVSHASLLDCATSTMYEVSINREAILDVFKRPPPSASLHVHTLHLALVHMRDRELVLRIMTDLFRDRPEFITAQLLKEYLIGNCFIDLIDENAPNEILSVVAIGTSESNRVFEALHQRVFAKHNVGVSELSCYPMPDGETAFKGVCRLQFDRRLSADATFLVPKRSPRADQGTSVRRFLRSLLGSKPAEESPPLWEEPIDDLAQFDLTVDQIDGWRVVKLLMDHFHANTPTTFTKQQCRNWALFVRERQLVHSKRVFSFFGNGRFVDDVRASFSLHSHFVRALEEVSFPYPAGLMNRFSLLAVECVPRTVFLQLIDRGIVCLTAALHEAILTHLVANEGQLLEEWLEEEKNRAFYLELASRQEDELFTRRLLMYLGNPQLNRLLLEESFTRVDPGATRPDVDWEASMQAQFLPLSALESQLCSEGPFMAQNLYGMLTQAEIDQVRARPSYVPDADYVVPEMRRQTRKYLSKSLRRWRQKRPSPLQEAYAAMPGHSDDEEFDEMHE